MADNKNIKDYLHLYLGCKGIVKTVAEFGTKLVAWTDSNDLRDGVTLEDAYRYDFKPILRPLSGITEQELRDFIKITTPPEYIDKTTDADFKEAFEEIKEQGIELLNFEDVPPKTAFEVTRWLLSKHFDLFGLIESGLAINSTTLKPQP
jgi:hypothetical protein